MSNALWFSSETLALYKSLTYLLNSVTENRCSVTVTTIKYNSWRSKFERTGIRKYDWNLRRASSTSSSLRSTSSEKHLYTATNISNSYPKISCTVRPLVSEDADFLQAMCPSGHVTKRG